MFFVPPGAFRHLRTHANCCHNAFAEGELRGKTVACISGFWSLLLDWDTNSRGEQLQLSIPLLLLSFGYMTVSALVSGTIPLRGGTNISRTTAPLGFWLMALGMAGITVFGSTLAFRYRESIWGKWESYRRKLVEGISLFCFLLVIYTSYVSMHLKVMNGAANQPQPDALFGLLAKLCIISALPFAGLAYFEKYWRSNDAAPICLGAWVVVCVGFSCKCQICALGLALPFVPFVLSALVAHGLGILCRSFRPRDTGSLFRA